MPKKLCPDNEDPCNIFSPESQANQLPIITALFAFLYKLLLQVWSLYQPSFKETQLTSFYECKPFGKNVNLQRFYNCQTPVGQR